MADRDLDLSGRMLGDYVLRTKIGEGGWGLVYRAEQKPLDREVVVKVLHGDRIEKGSSVERFLREARLASQLDHPYAAHVYGFGVNEDEEDGELWWIAMELVRGVTLADWLEAHGAMPLERAVPYFECVAEVVYEAHEHGIIHRDLKASNMMVIERGGRLFPKLLDFGIAKVDPDGLLAGEREADRASTSSILPAPGGDASRTEREATTQQQLTRNGVAFGSAPYMAPEQWRDAAGVGPAADIYSLGVVIYETLSGRRPFSGKSTTEYERLHVHAEVPPVGIAAPSLWFGVSKEIDRVLRRALSKYPECRHRSVLELAADLRAVLGKSDREQLRSAAQQWQDRAHLPGLLWGDDVLADVEVVASAAAEGRFSELECSYIVACQRRARHRVWVRRALIALAAALAVGGFLFYAAMQTRQATLQTKLAQEQTRLARKVAEATATQAELERGRSALLHDEPEAQAHLAEAYKRDPSPTTKFMLARSIQPRLAELARFASTYGRMWWATFSPNGRQIATADDRAAQIWDGRTHQLLFTLPHGCEVYQAVYSPDSTRLVTAAETMVRIWDTASGALVRELKAKPGGQTPSDYYRAAISPDGRLVAATGAAGSVVHVWDAANGALVAELRSRAAQFPRLAFSPDGWLAITGGNEARLFDVRTWRQVVAIPGPIHSLAFDAHSRLVTGAATGEVALWTIPSGARLHHLRPFGESVDAVAVSPDGQLVAAGSRDGSMQVWQASSGALRSQLNPRHSKILAVEFDRTSTLLLAANADGTAVVADAAQGLPVAILEGPQNIMRIAGFGPSSQVAGASWDGTARVWDASSPYRRWSSEPVSDDCGIGMGSEPDGRFVSVGCGARPTRVWDTAHDQLLAELPNATQLTGGGFMSAFPAVSAGGNRAAIARGNGVGVYQLPGGRPVRTVEHGAPVSAVAFASAGQDLVSGAVDGSVLVTHDDGTQRALQASAGIDAAELLPDGRVIVSDAERRLRVYASDGAVLAELDTPARIMSLRRDGARVVALPIYIGNAAPPLLIDLDHSRIIAQLQGHVGRVFSARWVSEGRILTAGADGTARLWDGATGRLLQTYRGSPRFLADATLAPQGLVIAGDADGFLRFWDAVSGAKLWTLQAHKSAVIGVHIEGGDIVTRGFTGEISRWRLPRPEQVIDACAHHTLCAIVPR